MKKISPSLGKKQKLVSELKASYSASGGWLFAFNYKSLTAAKFSALRRALRGVGATVAVVKNRVNRFVLDGTGFNSMSGSLSGQIASVFGPDPVAIVKILKASQDDGGIQMVAASDGSSFYDSQSLVALANLPSVETLRAKLLGVMLSSSTKLVSVLLEPCRSLMRVCDSSAKRVV